VGRHLLDRGHQVTWAGHPRRVRPLLFEGADLIELDDRISEEDLQALTEKSNRVRGLEGMKFLWEEFLVPLSRAMLPGVEAAVESYRPDVLVTDQQAIAGALVARSRDMPWATFTTSAAGVVETPLPKVWAWVLNQMATLQREAGLEVVDRPDISPHLMVVFTTEALIGESDFPAHYHFVGPSISKRTQEVPFPWDSLRNGPRILVSLGTVNPERGARFYSKLIEVMSGSKVQCILAAPEDLLEEIPENFIVQKYVPQLALLEKVDAVVCHAGQNTVSETLSHGLPLVVTPIKDDQGLIATQVAAAGAGVRVRYGRLQASELKEAITRVLEDPAYKQAALKIKASFEAAGGSQRAADLLEALL
jgi:MGT family glycosyltransferase